MISPPDSKMDSTKDCLLQLAHEARRSLAAAPLPKEVTGPELEWLDERLDQWNKQAWRIGVIGITSSGKSTLLNALLGVNILPARVGPTSNCTVFCESGDELEATIFYEKQEQPEKILLDEEAMRERLATVADEYNNRGNKLQVTKIHVRSPSYRLPSDVFLVDTPGLDAYGLDAHEHLTVDIFLPTVDAVIFITTAKANSDARIREYLDRAAGARKPIILVQNMIDAIKPKLGIGGREERTKDEVRKDHFRRMKDLLKRCAIPLDREVPVCQVSARTTSGISELTKLITERFQQLLPQRRAGRLGQLQRHLSQLAYWLKPSEDPAVAERELQDERDRLSELSKEVSDLLPSLELNCREILNRARKQGKKLRNDTINLSESEVVRARQLWDELKRWLEALAKNLRDAVATFQSHMADKAKKLNLQEENYTVRIAPLSSTIDTVPKTVRTHRSRTKAPGCVAWIKRFVFAAESGYVVHEWSEEVVKVEAFTRSVREATNNATSWLSYNIDTLIGMMAERLAFLEKEIHRQQRVLQTRATATSESSHRAALGAAMAGLAEQAKDQAQAESVLSPYYTEAPISEPPEEWPERPIHTLMLDILELAHEAASKRHTAIRNLCVDRIQATCRVLPSRLLVWGWDALSLHEFRNRFLVEAPTITPLQGFDRLKGPEPFIESLIVDEGNLLLEKSKASFRIEKVFKAGKSAVFLLVDFHQVGETSNHIVRSPVLSAIRRGFPLILVAQSLLELRHCGPNALAEAFFEMKSRVRQLGLQPIAVIANDDSVVMSDLIDLLLLRDEPLNSKFAMHCVLEELGILDAGNFEERLCHDVLREWEYWANKEKMHGF